MYGNWHFLKNWLGGFSQKGGPPPPPPPKPPLPQGCLMTSGPGFSLTSPALISLRHASYVGTPGRLAKNTLAAARLAEASR